MMNFTKEIDSITFGIYSPKEVKNMSVCCIDTTKKTGPGSVYDNAMGPGVTSQTCGTCKDDPSGCVGHFGHIEFAEMIMHPCYYRHIMSVLGCICFKCFRLALKDEQLAMDGFSKIPGVKRFKPLCERMKKLSECCHDDCGADKPLLKLSTNDFTIHMVHEDKKKSVNMVMTTNEIFKILDSISDTDVRSMGFDPELSHPRNFIISNLPVLPPVDRPYVQVNGNVWDDDLTIQYIEIVKANDQLIAARKEDPSEITENKRQKALSSLIFRVSTTFNNGQNKAKHTPNARPIKGIKERLSGKEGQLRSNSLGKRCNHTARTVIGPDPTLKAGELAMPEKMAGILTTPVMTTQYNINELQGMVNRGEVDTLTIENNAVINIKRYRLGTRLIAGDVVHRADGTILKVSDLTHRVVAGDRVERAGKFIDNIKISNRDYDISVGMVVNRHLRDGDVVLLNRQPTLHKGSMMAMSIVVRPHKTIRMNLAICKSFNADFDGDEMNIHVPQSLETIAELTELSSAKHCLISAQSSKPNMAIVQDSLLGAYKMTTGINSISKGKFFNILMDLDLKDDIFLRMKHIRRVLKQNGLPCTAENVYSGKGIISMFLPIDFSYQHENKASPTEPVVIIREGVLCEGVLDKSLLGSSHSSLLAIINKEYGSDVAMHFIDCIHFTTSKWLLTYGFSIGLGDCLVTDSSKEREVSDVIHKCFLEADGIKKASHHPGVREIRVNGALGKARDVGLKIAKEALDPSNNFLATVNSGSKGDFFNITQITGLLGQQNLRGARVKNTMNNGKRSLPHYPMSGLNPSDEYESRGFISSSFIQGLNPREFYFHAMSGREGITDTAMSTATSGYMQRRIVKLTEDIKIQYDGTVRDSSGKIYQSVYGVDGADPSMTTLVKGRQRMCDVGRLIDNLNTKAVVEVN